MQGTEVNFDTGTITALSGANSIMIIPVDIDEDGRIDILV
jgi:hypothetical protein